MPIKKQVLLLLISLVVAGCGAPGQQQRIINIGMLLARGGLGDRSFNDSAYSGLQQVQKQPNIRFETVDFTTDEANTEGLRRFAREKYDLIIGIGFENAVSIKTVAAEFPEQRFAIIDTAVEGPNVASIIYREPEGDFLMGVLAAMLTKTNQVGFIGGVDLPVTRRIESGFRQGVAYQNPAVTVTANLAGTFTDPEAGKSLALQQYASGIDIIYNGAGRTGLGIIEAAKSQQKLTIGTSGDQRYLAPGFMVGNRPKRMDTAVVNLVNQVTADQFKAGTISLGLKEAGLAIGPFDPALVTAEMQTHLETLQQKIISGEIAVKVDE
jgi:basic membrane protein A and related proteins